jgi:hypothetical protein
MTMSVTEMSEMQGVQETKNQMPPSIGQEKLEVRNLHAYFDKNHALHGINLKIP